MNLNIKGLQLINNFINDKEEKQLLENIYNNLWDESIKRRVQHYGLKFEYKYRKAEKKSIKDFPNWLKNIVNKLIKIDSLKDFNPNQCTINEYLPGIGIASHIDTHSCFGNSIVSLSLENPIFMNFQNKIQNDNKIEMLLQSKSVLILKDKARYCYTHGIAFRKTDKYGENIIRRKKRVSITFREIKETPCKCKWSSLCDSQEGVLEPTRL